MGIKVLDKSVFNRISAGEVVERPCSVVKELIENSIDAKATEIRINVDNGGTDLIEVADNGVGIAYDELPIAFLAHATSKISTTQDLDNICTLGFRGEALPSISAVSRTTIVSKQENEMGGIVKCYGGYLEGPFPITTNIGTIVTVKDLFYNTPVRAKFLKTPKSEEAEISNIVSRMMLAHPEIKFKYEVNSKIVYQTFGDGLESAMINVYGYSIINNCFYIETVKNGISVKGYIGKHNFSKPNRTYQTLIVNGRYVINNTVSSAISNAYDAYLMKRQYPFFVLNVDLAPEFVDVNVHPNKTEIRFQNNQVVYGTIYSIISSVLDGSNKALDIVKIDQNKDEDVLKEVRTTIKENLENFESKNTIKEMMTPYQPVIPKKQKVADSRESFVPSKEQLDIFAQNKEYIEKLEKSKIEQEKIEIEDPTIFIGQAFNTFLIYQKKDDLYIVDQHAAHERLLYDRMLNYSYGNIVCQPLLVPIKITTNPLEEQVLETVIPYLKNIGITIEKTLDKTGYLITVVPVELIDININMLVEELTNDFKLIDGKMPTIIQEKVMQKACKSAIKAGDKLSKQEIDTLTKKLNEDFGLKCPHGRPIAIKITKNEIYKWFKRIV